MPTNNERIYLGIGLAICLNMSLAHADETITVVSWGGAFQAAQREAYFEPYMQATGVTIREDKYSGETAKMEAMVQTGNYEWDVVDVTTSDVVRLCRAGLAEPLDWSKIGDRGRFLQDTTHECGVGISTWSAVWAYDADRVKDAPKTSRDFFDIEKFPGKRGLRRTAKITLEFALVADGVPPDQVYDLLATEEGVDRAFRKLDQIKDHVVWWEHGEQPQQFLANKEVKYTMAYNGRVYTANVEEGRNFQIVWDGQVLELDWWVVLKDDPRADLAMDFIAFTVKPQQQAALANRIPYGPTVKDAESFVDSAMVPHLPTSEGNFKTAVVSSGEFWALHRDALRERFEAWLSR